ncbi:MAG TPA: hypothetical protein VJ831_02940, partial [Jatrophihabitantaceae bacterium]|nr:hypothetical protein [Jatrophihabitantaceae bacterium]
MAEGADRPSVDVGRVHYAARNWTGAYDALLTSAELPEDLERLATAAFMIDDPEQFFVALERAHQGYLTRGDLLDACRCGRWIGLMRFQSGDMGQGSGWMARVARLVEQHGAECVDIGYLRIPEMFMHEAQRDFASGLTVAEEVTEIARRFDDADLFALAVFSEGQFLISLGRVDVGLSRLDEAMVALTAGELSPIVSGIVYCGVILGCRAAYDVARATEWTAAMTRWCDEQQGLRAFSGRCHVHRAEILDLHGSWLDAITEIDSIVAVTTDPETMAGANYLRGDLRRRQGRFDEAEAAYHEAKEFGREPQPGLALLRLAQGSTAASATMIGLALREISDTTARPPLLAGAVEILLAAGDTDAAAAASGELTDIAAANPSRLLAGLAGHAAGQVALAASDPEAALPLLRSAADGWRRLDAPYELARTRALIGVAARELGDTEGAAFEFAAARTAFTEL